MAGVETNVKVVKKVIKTLKITDKHTFMAPTPTPVPETPTPEVTVESETPQTQAAVAQPTAYTIKKGDTLIGISLRNYGSNTKVSEICALNGITDPDDIKIGQEILLP